MMNTLKGYLFVAIMVAKDIVTRFLSPEDHENDFRSKVTQE